MIGTKEKRSQDWSAADAFGMSLRREWELFGASFGDGLFSFGVREHCLFSLCPCVCFECRRSREVWADTILRSGGFFAGFDGVMAARWAEHSDTVTELMRLNLNIGRG